MQEIFISVPVLRPCPGRSWQKSARSSWITGDSGLSVVELRIVEKHSLRSGIRQKSCCGNCCRSPNDYAVLFMHGGATSQFSMLPLNFLGRAASLIMYTPGTGL